MTVFDGYLPVPTTSRERNVRPAITRGSEVIFQGLGLRAYGSGHRGSMILAAADKPDNFNLVAIIDDRVVVLLTLHNHDVVLDRDDAGIDVERGEQGTDGDRPGDVERFAVQ